MSERSGRDRGKAAAEDDSEEGVAAGNFIRDIIDADLSAGRHTSIVTRFPPEPNGRLHVGHVKAICINFGIARDYPGARCHLRFDDTNPSTEDTSHVDAIIEDVRWLGFDWGEDLFFASDYFPKLYEYARTLIGKGLAYVCDLSAEDHFAYRGTLTEPGRPSPFRERSVDENLELFARMRAGEFEPGERVLRAKIDMASSVLPMRDPILYRIQKVAHHRTGTEWPIYPMYDFAHCLSDAIEGVTHSLCSLEFVDHRPLYEWLLEKLEFERPPRQIEFARLNLSHTVLSKRYLRRLVEEGHVEAWDDPRMPTISGMRRRGYPAAALRRFCDEVGVARRENTIELARLEYEVRQELNASSPRAMAVLDPLEVVIEDFAEGEVDELEAINHPGRPELGTRLVPFTRRIYIERDDFMEDPPKKFFRLAPGREVRLRYAYFITCTRVEKDAEGNVLRLHCSHDPATRGGDAPDGRKVKGTLHWVSAERAVDAELRLYDTLFDREDPNDVEEGKDFTANLDPASLERRNACKLEPSLAEAAPGDHFQFERQGYFRADPDSAPGALVFNRTATLRDTWAKVQKKR